MMYRNIIYFSIIFTISINAIFSQSLQDLQKLRSEYEKIKNQQISLQSLDHTSQHCIETIFFHYPYPKYQNFPHHQIDQLGKIVYFFLIAFRRNFLAFLSEIPCGLGPLLGGGPDLFPPLNPFLIFVASSP